MANTFAQATTVCIAAGTVSAPGLYLSTDTNTGIYQSANNELALTVDGTQRLKVTATGVTVTGLIFGGGLRGGRCVIGMTHNNSVDMTNNLYYSGGWKAYGNGPVSLYMLGESASNGDYVWKTGDIVSGGAGTAVTMTERMRLSVAGVLSVPESMTIAGGYGSTGVTISNAGNIQTNGTIYSDGNISALSFTDRTPFYDGDGVAEICGIRGAWSEEKQAYEIDHETLPPFAQIEVQDNEGNTVIERDLGNMVSILCKAVQQLAEKINKKEEK